LRIAPELYLKRLVVGGFERVYEINRSFRNEGISTKHNPEFTMIEYYIAHHNYLFMMKFTQEMLQTIVQKVCGTKSLQYGSYTIDFENPFITMTMRQAVSHFLSVSLEDLMPDTISAVAKNNGMNFEQPWGIVLNELFDRFVEPRLIQPTFITEFPVEVSPLAKRNETDPLITDRFELYIAGMEVGNGFNELNDPFDQAERFAQQSAERARGSDETHYFDSEYIAALEYGLPPTTGAGIGIDRLAMLLTNVHSIRDVILFPTLKPAAGE
jgi:lysyl-tRNA synthetase, class II